MRALLFAVALGTPTDWELVKQGKELPGDRDLDMVNARMAAMAEKMEQNNQAVVGANPMLEDKDGLKTFLQDSERASLLESGNQPEHIERIKAKPLTADEERQQDIAKFDSVSDSLDRLTNFVQKGGAKIKADTDFFEKQIAAQREEQDRRLHPSKYATGPMTSLVQVSENPDDGFAKVEAKLKALQEKIKADTAKFEQEAKAAPSSLLQESESPDDGFAKVEAKLKALQEKIKADTAKFEQEAKAAPSSLLQQSESPDDGFAKVEAKLKALQEKIKADAAKFAETAKTDPGSLASSFLQMKAAEERKQTEDKLTSLLAQLDKVQAQVQQDTAKFAAEAKQVPSSLAEIDIGDPSEEELMERIKALSAKMEAVKSKFLAEADADDSAARRAADRSSLVEENMRKA